MLYRGKARHPGKIMLKKIWESQKTMERSISKKKKGKRGGRKDIPRTPRREWKRFIHVRALGGIGISKKRR